MKTYCELQIETNNRRLPCRGTCWWILFFLIWTSLALAPSLMADQFGDFTYETNASAVTITAYTGLGGNVIIPATIVGLPVTAIGDSAFAATGLTGVTLPNSVTSIGLAAFYSCTTLTNAIIPSSVSLIGESAFEACLGLTSVTFPGVTSIGLFAFATCTGLTSVTFPNTLTNLGGLAFFECTGLTTITIPSSVTSIGESPFNSCTGVVAITVDALNPTYSSADGVLLDKAQELLIQYPVGKVGSYSPPHSVTIIGESAFYGCLGLTSVTLPSVTSIGSLAFQDCSGLTDVTLPNSLTSIGVQAFAFTGLTSIAIPSSVTNIENQAFAFTKLTSVTVPNSITHLRDRMFRSCDELTTVTLPESLTSIKDYIFQDNSESGVEAVTGVYFKGNAPTTVGTAAFRGANNATVYYRAGTTGWSSTFAGRPTALWVIPSYSEWAQSFGLPTQYPAASGPQDDADQDGLTNIQEMEAGTDPTNSGSVLRMEQQPRPGDLTESDKTSPSPNQFALYFQSIPGEIYELQSTPTLGSPWKSAFTVISATTQKRVLMSKPISKGFYRVFLSPCFPREIRPTVSADEQHDQFSFHQRPDERRSTNDGNHQPLLPPAPAVTNASRISMTVPAAAGRKLIQFKSE